jgi:hypothetical protein
VNSAFDRHIDPGALTMSANVLSRTVHFTFGLDCRPNSTRDSPARRRPPRVRQRRRERTWLSAVLFLSRTAVAIMIVLPLLAGVTEAGSGFSNASLNGTYAFRTSGDSLFTSPDEVTSTPVFLAAVGIFQFDGLGRLTGSVAVNATRSRSTPSGKYGGAYSSQIHCNAKMVGTYTVDPLGTGTMTINFTPERGSPTCGASTGLFDIVLVSDRLVEVASSGQIMADPSKGEFNAYVVHGEIIKRLTSR